MNVVGKILHRSCFRCARCQSQLSIANYYETEKEGTYCCEMCPDEENVRETEIALSKMTLERNKKLDVSQSDPDETESSDENEDAKETFDDVKKDLHLPCQNQEAGDENSLPESQQDAEDKLVVTIQLDQDESNSNNATIHIDTISSDLKTDEENTENLLVKDDKDISPEGEKVVINASEIITSIENSDKDDSSAPMLQPECDQVESQEEKPTVETLEIEDYNEIPNITTLIVNEENTDIIANPESQISSQDCLKEANVEKKLEDISGNTTESIKGIELAEESAAPATHELSHDERDDNQNEISYPSDMNPFGDDSIEDQEKPIISVGPSSIETDQTETSLNTQTRVSTNPFGSDFEESEEEDAVNDLKTKVNSVTPLNGPPKPPRTPSMRQSMNPFGSDFEDDEEDSNATASNVIISPNTRLSANYANITLRSPPSPALSTGSRSSTYASNKRKKRPAPPPPQSNVVSNASPKLRTSIKPAAPTRTNIKPSNVSPTPAPRTSKLPVITDANGSAHRPPPRPPPPTSNPSPCGELPKSRKEKDNLNRRSQCMMQLSQASVVDTTMACGTVTQSSNLNSAGTSEADSSSIMSGSITSTR